MAEGQVMEGQVIDIDIDGLAGGGDGVGRWQGMAVFVPGALPGERVRVCITQVKKSFARGKLEDILSSNKARIDPECRSYTACGGCHLQHIDYKTQLEYKRQIVIDALERIGRVAGVTVYPVIGMKYPWHYRNKVHLQVVGKKGNITLGFFAPGSYHVTAGAGNCRLVNSLLNETAAAVQKLLNKYLVEPYNWKRRRGLLRHVMLRAGGSGGEVMVVFITAPGEWQQGGELALELMNLCPEVVSVVRNINKKPRQVVLGTKNLILGGRDYIISSLGGLQFCLSANSFYQVNSFQAERLYETAKEYAALTGAETVIDAYCGTGTIALYLAGSAARVVGLEIMPQAVADARQNARLNAIQNVEFRAGQVEKTLPDLVREGLQPDVVVLDPPRAGCDEVVLQTIAKTGVPRVVYVSCNPATLARDLERMTVYGYRVLEVQPVDMFPWTAHVETVCLMSRK